MADVFYTFSGENVPRVPLDNDVFALDLSTHHWRRIPATAASPSARVGHAAAVLGGRLYIYAGRTGAEFADHTLSDVWAFDPSASEWSEVQPTGSSPRPPPLSYHTMTASSTHVFLFGGCTVDHGRSNALWAFDVSALSWEKLSEEATPGPVPCGGASIVFVDGAVHALFGYNGKHELDQHFAFDLSTRAWTPIVPRGSPPASRSVTDAVYLPALGAIWAWGGEYTPSAQGHEGAGAYHGGSAYLFDVKAGEWRTVDSDGEGPSARGWFNTCGGSDGRSVVLFGGYDGNARVNDAWTWTADA